MENKKQPTNQPRKEQQYDLVLEVDGNEYGLLTTFNPDAGTPHGDIDIYDKGTGKFIDEMCHQQIPSEANEEEVEKIRNYIRENFTN